MLDRTQLSFFFMKVELLEIVLEISVVCFPDELRNAHKPH